MGLREVVSGWKRDYGRVKDLHLRSWCSCFDMGARFLLQSVRLQLSYFDL